MIKAVVRNIEHHIGEGMIELSVIVPMPEAPLEPYDLTKRLPKDDPKVADAVRKQEKTRKEFARKMGEWEVELERLLQQIRLGAIDFRYITDKKEARELTVRCGRTGVEEFLVGGRLRVCKNLRVWYNKNKYDAD